MPSVPVENLSQLYARPGFVLRRAHQISVAIFEECCVKLALSPAQYAVLIAMNDLPGASQGDVARAVGMNKVTVSQVVKALEERGWVKRKTGTSDRRCRQLVLSRSGRNAVARSGVMVQRAYETLMSPFDEEERRTFSRLLGKIVNELGPHARARLEPVLVPDAALLP